MININRPLVKSQARQIIKGKVFALFIIVAVVLILISGTSTTFSIISNYNQINDFSQDGYFDEYDDFDADYFGDFNGDGNPIEDFEFSSTAANTSANQAVIPAESPVLMATAVLAIGSSLGNLLYLIFSPMSVTTEGMFVSLVRRNANEKFELGKELSGIFSNTFNATFGKKLVLIILLGIIMFFLSLLLVFPAIIFYYSAYFAPMIMNDYPNIKPSQAISLSKKIVRGHRGELFVYDLSFLPWLFLTIITVGIAGIYTIPYKRTADALYYENFRLRALANGVVTEDDFLSEQELMMKYSNSGFNGYNNPYQQASSPYYNPSNSAPYSQTPPPYANYSPYHQYQPQAPQPNAQYSPNGFNPLGYGNGTFYEPDFSIAQPYTPAAGGNFDGTAAYNQPNEPTYQPPEQNYQPQGGYQQPVNEQYQQTKETQPAEQPPISNAENAEIKTENTASAQNETEQSQNVSDTTDKDTDNFSDTDKE